MSTRMLAVAAVLVVCACGMVWAAEEKPVMLASFEVANEDVKHTGEVVKEHATDGASALKLVVVEGKGGSLDVGKKAVKKFAGMDRLLIDSFNAGDQDLIMTLKLLDAKSNKEESGTWALQKITFKPGQSTIDIQFDTLKRKGDGSKIDVQSLARFQFYFDKKAAGTLFLDNLRLVKGEAPAAPAAPEPPAAPEGE